MALHKIGFLALTLFVSLALSHKHQTSKTGVARLNYGGQGIYAVISFVNIDGIMHIMGTIGNLTDGKHGIHIHESSDVRDNCSKIGDHYNPYNKTHSCDPENGHFGDLGNVESTNGIAYVNRTVKGMTLAYSNGKEGNQNPGVAGLTLAVDKNPDSCKEENDGGSAPVIACGWIFPI